MTALFIRMAIASKADSRPRDGRSGLNSAVASRMSVNAQADAQQVWLTGVAIGAQPFSRDEAFATSPRSARATLSFYGGDMKKRTQAAEQKKVDKWNANHPVGTAVDLLKDGGETIRTKTVSLAEVLSGHTAVIWLEGVSGCYLLDRVKAV